MPVVFRHKLPMGTAGLPAGLPGLGGIIVERARGDQEGASMKEIIFSTRHGCRHTLGRALVRRPAHLGGAQTPCSLAGQIRSEPGRSVRAAAGCCRHDQDIHQRGLGPAFCRQGPFRHSPCDHHGNGPHVLCRYPLCPGCGSGGPEYRIALLPRHDGPRRIQYRACRVVLQ